MAEYDVNYLLESVPEAVRALATGFGNLRERLYLAYLAIHHLQPEAMPEALRADLEWVLSELTKRDPPQAPYRDAEGRSYLNPDGSDVLEGKVAANIRTMRKNRASAIADRIVTLNEKLLGMKGVTESARPGSRR